MNAATDRIEREILLKAPLALVWRALANAGEFGNWFGVALQGQAFAAGQRTRGQFTSPGYEQFVFEVLVEQLEPERLLSFRWTPYPVDPGVDFMEAATTLVVFTLQAVEGGTLLRVVESGFDAVPAEHRRQAYEENSSGWDEQMLNIEKHVATP